MRMIVALFVALFATFAILAPVSQAVAHDGYQKGSKYRSYKNSRYKRRYYTSRYKRRYYTSRYKRRYHVPPYISHHYSDMPVWAGIAFTPKGRY